jgi:hypothetical protein
MQQIIEREKHSAMIELRRMERNDKIQYPGAFAFRDGMEPFIGCIQIDRKPITVIVDDHGLEFAWGEFREKRLPLEAGDLLNILFQLQNKMSEESLQEILSNYCCRLEW